MEDREFLYLKRRIKALMGVDLDNYREPQMRRRLNAFVSRTAAPNVVTYCRMLEQDPRMLEELRRFLTIKVTEFFRDPLPFDYLAKAVLPDLLGRNHRLRIWSTGCSTGGEPYSLALLLRDLSPYARHTILATDIDEVSLVKARAGGPYRASEVKNVPPHLLENYFRVEDGFYWVSDRIRQTVIFRQHDLLCDAFESEFDIILCRNVTIYFTDLARSQLNSRFFKSLKPGGVLFIGATESLNDGGEQGFSRLAHCFYLRPGPARAESPSGEGLALSVGGRH
jgi:chemotaxis protein methyltransferase CheR